MAGTGAGPAMTNSGHGKQQGSDLCEQETKNVMGGVCDVDWFTGETVCGASEASRGSTFGRSTPRRCRGTKRQAVKRRSGRAWARVAREIEAVISRFALDQVRATFTPGTTSSTPWI